MSNKNKLAEARDACRFTVSNLCFTR